jgi:hypothetical protein
MARESKRVAHVGRRASQPFKPPSSSPPSKSVGRRGGRLGFDPPSSSCLIVEVCFAELPMLLGSGGGGGFEFRWTSAEARRDGVLALGATAAAVALLGGGANPV